ncbi:LAMI_0A03906g1_1 [Lachancea mirantina]|uniref:LAMI_0A03906g1_1 n=1 Tax=Lachancea mirantina TaxID=1230905 RepID=A0A1G4INH0_9SACH|nr:LAMI_0A03906g1_1 [Lachancea mirantina]
MTDTLTYEQVKEIVESPTPNTVLIDVRELDDFKLGSIPSSVNMPYNSYPNALDLDSEEFNKTFGFAKPSKTENLVIYCASGFRAKKAQDSSKKAGYTNVLVYPGSYNEWSSKLDDSSPQENSLTKLAVFLAVLTIVATFYVKGW